MSEPASHARKVNKQRGRPSLTTLALLLSVAAAGCAGTRELTRIRAAEMISDSEDFRRPVSLPLKREVDWIVRAQSEGETEAEAEARAVEKYYQVHSQMDVLRRLGLMGVRATVRRRPETDYLTWVFDVEPLLTEKGARVAGGGGREGRGGPAVAIAAKEFIEVAGITEAGGAEARVEYRWREVPTEAGRAFVPGSPEYQALPAPLRQTLAGRNQTKDFSQVKRGAAVFRLYDDGWRILAAQ
ncbi:MAG TPA: hypothetical protein VN282_05700 [Pyrinomonadaceae bacterium]|nr:hypothetical protein [Pyrinomonadaceae bacterium]